MRAQRQLGVVAAVPAALGAAALSAPLLAAAGYSVSAFAIFQFFSVVCHQDAARSFWIAGAPVAVCARCIGIYLGVLFGAWVRAPRKQVVAVLASIGLVSLLDAVAESAGLHGDWPLVRFVLGGILGAGLGTLMGNATR